jgi:hypothetical protein
LKVRSFHRWRTLLESPDQKFEKNCFSSATKALGRSVGMTWSPFQWAEEAGEPSAIQASI